MTFHARIDSPLGRVLLCANNGKLSGLYFTGQSDCPVMPGAPIRKPESGGPSTGTINGLEIRKLKAYRMQPDGLFPHDQAGQRHFWLQREIDVKPAKPHLLDADVPDSTLALFRQTQIELAEYFAGTRKTFDIPLDVSGTGFQTRVWRALRAIPYGEIVSYGAVARLAGLTPAHGRPVGTAVGHNPITIIIPCHRVVSATHSLTGYTGGLERKLALLELEGFVLR